MLTSSRLVRRAVRFGLGLLNARLRDGIATVALQLASVRHVQRLGLFSIEGALALARENGFRPGTIIDAGAYVGDWSRMAHAIYAEARLLMIDGNPARTADLGKAALQLGPGASYAICLLGAEEREAVTLHQLDTGTSVLPELTSYLATQIRVRMRPLDAVATEVGVTPPVLLKLDVQGYELEVLKGSGELLKGVELVVLEVATLPYNEGAPLFAEVVEFMRDAGFDVYDFGGSYRRETDHALFQIDVVFVKRGSPLRATRKFWLNEP